MRFDDQEEIEIQLKDLEYLIKKCRIRYEQFFMGNEKREPLDMRNKITRILKHSPLEQHRRAAVRFRFLNLTQQFVTLSNYWDRVSRMKEEGTFNYMSFRGFRPRAGDAGDAGGAAPVRDEPEQVHHLDPEDLEREAVARAANAWHDEPVDGTSDVPEPEASPAPGLDLDAPVDLDALARAAVEALDARPAGEAPPTSARPAPPAPPPIPARPTPPAPAPIPARLTAPAPPPMPRPVASEVPPVAAARPPVQEPPRPAPARAREEIEALPGARALYDKYVSAKSSATTETEDLSFDQFERRLLKKRETLREKFEQDFEFDVVNRDGKVSIVARKR